MLHGLRTVAFHVADLEAAREWYTKLLGFPPYFDQPFYVGFEVGGYELGLQPAEPEGPSGEGGGVAYWAVDDADAALERMVALGATVRQPVMDVGGGIRLGTALDPFGNAIGVIFNPFFAERDPRFARAGDVSGRTLVREIQVPVPPEVVWPLWTTSKGMASWWATDNRIELRVGGPYEMYFLKDAPEGFRGGEGCRVLAFLAPRLIAFTWNAPPHLERTRWRYTWVVLELVAVGKGTRVRLTHTGWPESGWREEGTQWPETFAYFEDAWSKVLGRLHRHCAGMTRG